MQFSQLDPAVQMFLIMLFATGITLLIFWITGNLGRSYVDIIYSRRRYHVTKTFMSGATHESEVERIVIKREYTSGKIKFIEKEVKI